MEIQPEPLASAAPAATGPALATATTPLTTASFTPLTTETRPFIGQSSRSSISPALSLDSEDSPLVSGAASQREGGALSENNWLLLTSLAREPRSYWITLVRRGRGKERRAKRWVVFDVMGAGCGEGGNCDRKLVWGGRVRSVVWWGGRKEVGW